jgi:dihydropyrimidinase
MGRDDFRKIPNGGAGIEDRLALLYSRGVVEGRIDLNQFVALVSTNPAKIFGLYPRKGSLSVGADADVVVWDPAGTRTISATTHHHRCDRSLYEGFTVQGVPSTVLVNGEVAFRDGDLRVEREAGRFLKRTPRQ